MRSSCWRERSASRTLYCESVRSTNSWSNTAVALKSGAAPPTSGAAHADARTARMARERRGCAPPPPPTAALLPEEDGSCALRACLPPRAARAGFAAAIAVGFAAGILVSAGGNENPLSLSLSFARSLAHSLTHSLTRSIACVRHAILPPARVT